MQFPLRSRSPAIIAALAGWLSMPAAGQEPQEPPPGEPAAASTERRDPQRRRRQPLVIEAGTVHPVAGPAIENGVVVVRGERIAAVGRQGEVEVPPNAVVRSFPNGHVYPGLIDAHTDAYADPQLRGDNTLDGGAPLADDLRWLGERSDRLIDAGITTAYVAVRTGALLRGQGAIVRPRRDGFDLWQGKEQAAVQIRLTPGSGPSHPLQRQQERGGVDSLFDSLEDYRKAKADYAEALQKYEQEFSAYVDFHAKKKGDKPTGDAASPPAEARPAEPPAEGGNPGERRPRNRPPGGNGPGEAILVLTELFPGGEELLAAAGRQDPKPETPPPSQDPKPAPSGQGTPAPAADGPTRPTYPKKPPVDPQRDALLRVLDGELPLRVEVHRPDEVRAAIELQQRHQIPVLIVEQAFGAAPLAEALASGGIGAVLTEGLPGAMPTVYATFDTTRLPRVLHDAGVPFAIATGRARLAPILPLLAATAVGCGLPADAALRALTLTPAELLGIAGDTGSLAPGKLADIVVCDRPLLATDSQILLVVARGRPEFEVQ